MSETLVGGYQLGRCLGQGATATVHLGTRVSDGTEVACKVLHPELTDNAELVERFRREARTLRRLSHPHIVQFIDFVEDAPNFMFVMELLEGRTLEEYLADGERVPAARCLHWALQLAEALDAAHSEQVIHRDIKPANVFFTQKGKLILSDFGLARPEGEKVTRAGQKMLGTPLYMAPEQVVGRTATPATDIYQVGLCLYELFTGTRPFRRENDYERILARLEDDLFLPMDIECEPALREIIRRCGFKEPHRRYPDGATLAEDLRAATEGRPLPFQTISPEEPRKATLTTQGLDWKDPSHYQGTLLVCPRINLRFDPAGKAFFIGSDPAVDVFVESQEVAPRQLRISPNGPDKWRIESGNFQSETLVQGQPLRGETRDLFHGDIIQVSGFEFLWVAHPQAAAPAAAAPTPAPAPPPTQGAPAPAAPAARGCGAQAAVLVASWAAALAAVTLALSGVA